MLGFRTRISFDGSVAASEAKTTLQGLHMHIFYRLAMFTGVVYRYYYNYNMNDRSAWSCCFHEPEEINELGHIKASQSGRFS